MVLMDPARGPPGAPGRQLSSLSLPIFIEGVSLVVSKWTALGLAVKYGEGAKDSHELESAILSWFTQSNDALSIEALQKMLEERVKDSFNADFQDNSFEGVAKDLTSMYKECLQGNYARIEKLKTKPQTDAVSQSIRVINDDEDESSDDETSDMIVDEPEPKATAVEKPKPRKVPDEEGWTVVSSKRERGRRSG